MSTLITRDGRKVVIIGDSDEEADWLKYVDGGKHKEVDLKAHEAARKIHEQEDAKKSVEKPVIVTKD